MKRWHCGICGRFVGGKYPVCSQWHDELAGDLYHLKQEVS